MNWIRICCAIAFAIPAGAAVAQSTLVDSAKTLWDQGKHRAAVPLLERLIASGSSDHEVHFRLGVVLVEMSPAVPDAAARKAQRVRARRLLAKAIELGSDDAQAKMMVDAIPEDGGDDAVFSSRREVNEAMQRGEAAFGRNDMRAAMVEYRKALQLDPTLKTAAMFIGDTYNGLQLPDSAYVWYARATEISPDYSTAWRYWSDVLLKHGELDDARDKAIESIVADPFSNIAREPLVRWMRAAEKRGGLPRVTLGGPDSAASKSKARIAYDSVGVAWQPLGGTLSTPFTTQFPGVATYRHSLAEELQALRAAYRAGGDDARTAVLKALDDIGLLEAYIFFVRADDGIAEDYGAWRSTHRDQLRRFWRECVLGTACTR